MTVRPVVRLPAPVLQRPSLAVGEIDGAMRELAQDLIDTMRASPGCVGLAAPQIGVGRRAFVLDVTGHRKTKTCHGLVVMFDPQVVERGDLEVGREGCMSMPDLTGDAVRPATVVVRGRCLDGQELVVSTDAFEARAFQHEVDHLDGLLFLDRVRSSDGVFPRKVYR